MLHMLLHPWGITHRIRVNDMVAINFKRLVSKQQQIKACKAIAKKDYADSGKRIK